jgi:cytochrome c-type biogenesis protein CcmH/NrfG
MRFMTLLVAALLAAPVANGAGPKKSARGAASRFGDAVRLKKAGKHAAAAAAFQAIVDSEPKNVDALEQLATLQGWLAKHDEALMTWRKALSLAPENSDLRLGLARVLYWKGETKSSLKELAAVLVSQPESAEAWTLNGDVLLADGRPGEARKAYKKAKSLAPKDGEIDKKLARTEPSAP